MKNIHKFILFISAMLLFSSCSTENKEYEAYMASALAAIEKENLEEADQYLQQALAEKPKDEKATIYQEQVSTLMLALQNLADNNMPEASKQVDKVIHTKNGLDTLVKQAEQLQSEQQQKVEKKAERERKAAERERKEGEEDQQAIEKTERERKEWEKRGEIGPFKGYWLKDTMACHFANTYVACALAQSDFITYDEIIDINFISDNELELTFEDNIKNTFHLLDQNSLELADGVYKRVTKEEANAIYGGYYELP